MRDTTSAQDAVLDRRFTKPVYLVEIEVDGQEYLSTNANQEVGGQTWIGGQVMLKRIENGVRASIALRPTPERMAQFESQSWRYGSCRISLLPGTSFPLIWAEGYAADGYAYQGDVFADPILLIDGELVSGSVGPSSVDFEIAHRISVGRWLPAVRIAPPICNHLPRVGTVITWEGDRYMLEART